jgi:hypothetical protein
VFPVVFSKVQPPKTVAASSSKFLLQFQDTLNNILLYVIYFIQKVNKPIIEMCMILSHSQRTNTNEMKYFKVLIQEFFVKLDIIFISALMGIFTDKVYFLQ